MIESFVTIYLKCYKRKRSFNFERLYPKNRWSYHEIIIWRRYPKQYFYGFHGGSHPIYITLQCKKRLAVFPSPAGRSLIKLSLAGIIKLCSAIGSLVNDIPAGDGKTANLFYSVYLRPGVHIIWGFRQIYLEKDLQYPGLYAMEMTLSCVSGWVTVTARMTGVKPTSPDSSSGHPATQVPLCYLATQVPLCYLATQVPLCYLAT